MHGDSHIKKDTDVYLHPLWAFMACYRAITNFFVKASEKERILRRFGMCGYLRHIFRQPLECEILTNASKVRQIWR